MKYNYKKLLRSLVLICAAGSYAEIAPPAWVSDPDVISVTYRFETGDTEPAPSESANLFAAPALLIDKVTFASAGWADPGYPFITRDNGGTWELGETGYMDLFLPLVATPGPDLYASFFIEVIAATGLEVMPVIKVDGVSNPYTEEMVIEPDPLNMWHWSQQVCTGQVSLASASALSFSVTCYDTTQYGDASTIDQILEYTKVIPEPATISLFALAAVFLLMRRWWYG
jgi:hypothetical protein